jgi:hypothetical protein
VRLLLHDEGDLEQRRAGRVARGLQHFDQLLERHVLIRVRAERGLLHARQHLAQRRAPFDARPQDQHVDEEADEVFDLAPRPVRNRGSDDDVLLPGVAVEQHLEGREQHHEGRHALGRTESLHPLAQLGRERPAQVSAPSRRRLRPRAVAGQFQRRQRAPQPRTPVVQLPVERAAFERPALPRGPVRVLHPQPGQRGRAPLPPRLVERRELAHHHADRPAVRDDVRHDEREDVVAVSQLQQTAAQQRAALEVEGESGFRQAEVTGRRLALLDRPRPAQVVERQGQLRVFFDGRHRPALDRGDARPQRLVPAHDLAQAPTQRLNVQLALQPNRRGQVVGRALGLQTLQEPEPPLPVRQLDDPALPLRRLDPAEALAAPFAAGSPSQLLLYRAAQAFDGRPLEERPQRHLHPEDLPHPRHHPRRQQAVPAQLEEVRPRPDRPHA